MLHNIALGFVSVFTIKNFVAIFVGTGLGLFVGAMPGLSATMAIAILLPITFVFTASTGISMLAAIYLGAMYGGSIAAILLRTPGTPSAAATVMDGYPMAQKGQAGKALGISLISSFFGGLISSIVLLTIAPLLGNIALQFGPVELFSIAVLGITIIGSLSRGSTVKGLLSGLAGLLLAMIGMDPITGTPRFTFGSIYLFSGVPFTIALIGLFSIPQVFRLLEKNESHMGKVSSIKDRMFPSFRDIKSLSTTIIRSSFIGIFTGLIPGTGGDTACWFAYNEAKRFSKEPETFGHGNMYGVSSAESANNAVVGGALIPTITLGIPGSSATAVLLGGLMIHGILPGPTLMTEYADVTYTLICAIFVANFFMLAEGLIFTKACVFVTKVSNWVLAPVITILCVIGSFAINNSVFDVFLMFGFGVLGYFMEKVEIPVAPMVIGLILGHMLDVSFHQALLISHGSWLIFVQSPISAVILLLALLSILQSTPFFHYIKYLFRKVAIRS